MLTRIFAVTAVLTTIATTIATTAAQAIPVPPRTESLTPIAGRITQIRPIRVPLAPNVTGVETRVSLRFTLSGCLDSLLPVLSYSEVRGRSATIYVTALNANNPLSASARCVALPQATAQVSVPGNFQRQQVRVVFLGVPPEAQVVDGGGTQ